MKKIKVVITDMPYYIYFQWFLLGFYELEKKDIIKLKFKVPPFVKMLTIFSNKQICKVLNKFVDNFGQDYNLKGYVEHNKQKKYFTIDCTDSPYIFNSELLNEVDFYFKMQCPKEFLKEGFKLNSEITIPWSDQKHVDENIKNLQDFGERKECNNIFKNIEKIKPLMIGPRKLSNSLSYKALLKGYNDVLEGRDERKSKKVMCYFGDAKGPELIDNKDILDCNNESSIMSFFKGKINHPNEKRGKIAKIIAKLGKEYDARIINQGNSDLGIKTISSDEIPLKDFGKHVGQFEYNFNVSGYRLSIPNRFIDSFAVGTAIITDKLSVKWYLPFDKDEVIETVPMGYELDDKVNYDLIEKQIMNLRKSNSKKIIKNFEKKWKPEIVTKYILDTIIEK